MFDKIDDKKKKTTNEFYFLNYLSRRTSLWNMGKNNYNLQSSLISIDKKSFEKDFKFKSSCHSIMRLKR